MINHCNLPTWTILERFSGRSSNAGELYWRQERKDTMYDHTTVMLQARIYDQAQRGESGSAATLYSRSRRDGRRGRFWSARSRDSRCLLNLSEIEDACQVDARSYAGLHTVPIEQIRGSEGRSNDFDRDFHPLQDHCMSRWLRVAAARDQGQSAAARGAGPGWGRLLCP
jgi:hypothetical protein